MTKKALAGKEIALSEVLYEAQRDELEASVAYGAAKAAAMNKVARTIAGQGPTTQLDAYLFAMHGETFQTRLHEHSEQQTVYERMQRIFGLNAAGRLLVHSGLQTPGYFSLHFIPGGVLYTGLIEGSPRHSAVHFDINEIEQGFQGSAYVPTVSTMHSGRDSSLSWGYLAIGTTRREADQSTAVDLPQFSPDADIRLGRLSILEWQGIREPSAEAVARLQHLEVELERFAAQTGVPNPMVSPYQRMAATAIQA